jgi:lipopolysaccharide transport protein LptA
LLGVEKKQSFVMYGFIIFWCFIVFLSVKNRNKSDLSFSTKVGQLNQNQSQQESFFKNINYYVLKDSRPQLHLDASEVSVNNTSSKTLFFDPKGTVFSKNQDRINFQGMKGTYYQKRSLLHISRNVKMKVVKNSSILTSNEVLYKINMGRMDARGNVKTRSVSKVSGDKILIDADRAISWTKMNETKYFGNVNGKVIRRRVYEDPVLFKSNKLYLKMDDHLISLSGNVELRKQSFKANARRGNVYLENYNKKLKYFALYDDVKLVEKVKVGRSRFLRKAYAEQLEGIVSQDKMILTGYPRVFQQGDEIKGNKIILRENNDVVEVEDANSTFKSQ